MTIAYDTSDGTIMEALNNKADIDLNNLSVEDKLALIEEHKETIMGWMIPDYSKAESRSKGVEYIAECNGYIRLYLQNGTSNPFDFKIDDFGILYNPREGNHYNTYPPILIGKGQKYILSGNGTVGSYVFIPCKGAI